MELEPVSKVLLDGLYDKDCILFRLRGCQHVMKVIWEKQCHSVAKHSYSQIKYSMKVIWEKLCHPGNIQFATFFQIFNEGDLGGGGEGEAEGCCQAGEKC